MLLVVLIDGLKPIILSLNRLSSSKHLESLDRSRLLINLLRHEVRLIPLYFFQGEFLLFYERA